MANQDEPRPCARCGYVNDKDHKNCIKCGAPLLNKCADEPGLIHKGCSFTNKPEAAFCAKCGHPTIFNKEGIVTPHPSASNVPWPIRIS
ncbi:MAG: hypothetical protein ACO1OC_01690 [Tuberibacillus sp.]